jgi:hypothetical protein
VQRLYTSVNTSAIAYRVITYRKRDQSNLRQVLSHVDGRHRYPRNGTEVCGLSPKIGAHLAQQRRSFRSLGCLLLVPVIRSLPSIELIRHVSFPGRNWSRFSLWHTHKPFVSCPATGTPLAISLVVPDNIVSYITLSEIREPTRLFVYWGHSYVLCMS